MKGEPGRQREKGNTFYAKMKTRIKRKEEETARQRQTVLLNDAKRERASETV